MYIVLRCDSCNPAHDIVITDEKLVELALAHLRQWPVSQCIGTSGRTRDLDFTPEVVVGASVHRSP